MPYIMSGFITSGAFNYMYAHLIYAIFMVTIYAPLKNRQIVGNFLRAPSFWWLFFFGFFYVVIAMPSIQGLFYYLALPVLTYATGWMIYELNDWQNEGVVRRLIICMLIGFSIHAACNYSVNIDVPRWLVRDYFTGKIRSATGQGAINTFSMSLIGYWIFVEKKKTIRLVGMLLFIPSVLFMLQLGTRTQLLILVICFITTVVIYLLTIDNKSMIIRLCSILLLMTVICSIMYSRNTFGIRNIIESSTLFARMDENSMNQMDADQYRADSVIDGIVSLMENPIGVERESRFHNMWLDVGRLGGWFPAFSLLVFSLTVLTHVMRMTKNPRFSNEFRCMIFAVILGNYLNFCTEPIVEGLMDFFLAHLMVVGAIEAMYAQTLHKRENILNTHQCF